MIINRDGKLFGKISIIDIAVVLIVVILAIGIYGKFSGGTATTVTSGEKIECTFLVKNIRMYTVEALQKGGGLYDKTSKEFIGDIKNVSYEEGKYFVNMADGSFKTIDNPEDRYNAYVTVEFLGKTSNKGYYTAANKYLAAGTTVLINSKYAECESTVYSIGLAK